MTYRVLWTAHAERQFEQIIQAISDPAPITFAAREIDRSLAAGPNSFGESRYDNVRIAFARPLGVQFEVMADVRTVVVFEVWRTVRR